MRLSHFFSKTFKEAPAEADIPSHKLLEQAGYIFRIGRGLYAYSPMMKRVIEKLCCVIREEMENAGAQELSLPNLHPADIWHETGRWEDYTAENLLYALKDREGHDYCVAPTCEEAIVALVRSWVKSYKELPLNLYQIGNKFRDEIRPRFGLIRAKEFLMKDGYSFATTPSGMEEQYEKMRTAYSKILDRLGLDYVLVQAHSGKIGGGGKSQEFQVKTEIGEDVVMLCGDYAANVEATLSIPPSFPFEKAQGKKERVETPGITNIEDLAHFLKIQPAQIVKTLVVKLIFQDKKEFVSIGIRGDREVNLLKVQDHFGAIEIEMASDTEIEKLGSCVGFIGPLNSKLPFYADQTCKEMTNFCCASNEKDIHYIQVNWEKPPECFDFLLAKEGDRCPHIEGGTYTIQRGTEVAHIFNLGTKYSEKMKAHYQDENGELKPFWMGTYGIGVGRTAQACVEQMHDERGIVWPKEIAPFKILITAAVTKKEELVQAAEEIYSELCSFEPLYDDRDERLGFKLKDSDLIGIPYKLIVGKTLQENNELEIESRSGEKVLVKRDQLLQWAQEHL